MGGHLAYGKGAQALLGKIKKMLKTTRTGSSECLRCMSKPVWLEPEFIASGMKCARWLGLDHGGLSQGKDARMQEECCSPCASCRERNVKTV